MDPTILETLEYWIYERRRIKEQKEANAPKPWSSDPIFQQYKFCNVDREDDFVTRWFAHNWRKQEYWTDKNFIPAMILGRTINWPQTLARLGFPHEWEPHRFKQIMDDMQARGEKVYTGAYMITAGPTGVRKNDWVIGNAESYFKNPPILNYGSLQLSWEAIVKAKYPCVGPFIAGQVIADLKQTDHLRHAADWWDWAPLGPGSARGLNRIYDRKIGQSITQEQGLKEMREVKAAIDVDLCLQNVQNCLCELDKYMRVKLGQGKPRSSYPGLPY